MKMPDKKLISVIIPVYNEQNNIEKLFSRLFSILQDSYTWEIIFIDDGSTDKSAAIIKKLIGKHTNISLISFSRNYGHQIALGAGYHFAGGKAVISMDSDLQHPPEFVPTLIEQWEKGYEVVLARRNNMNQQTIFKRNTSRLYYYILNKISDTNIIENIADFRLLDKKVVDYLKQYNENTLFSHISLLSPAPLSQDDLQDDTWAHKISPLYQEGESLDVILLILSLRKIPSLF